MRVNPNNAPSAPTPGRAAQAKTTGPTLGNDKLTLNRSEKLVQTLKQLPASRTEKVARARNLVQDSAYPSDAVLRQVAGVLADHLKPGDPSA